MWGRVAMLALFMVAILVGAIGLVFKIAHPYREIASNQQQLASIDGQISQLDAQNQDLQQRIDYLKTRSGVVTEARKLGYFKSDEIPIVVEGAPTEWSDPPPATINKPAPGWKDRVNDLWHDLGRL
jgi:cell division protein FtsL